jgi:integrase
MARVIVDGRQVACRQFPPGKRGGPEWRAAKEWEEEQLRIALSAKENAQEQQATLTGLAKLLAWGESYLAHVERTMNRQTLLEKQAIMKAFFAFCKHEGIREIEDITRARVYAFLSQIADTKSQNRANVYRKNLLAAWNWGMGYIDGFPQSAAVIERVKPFPARRRQRYVPPEEDVIKVLRQAHGQDLVFLLVIYYTGARRSEVFRLSWERDIDFVNARIRLSDNKGGDGAQRVRWLAMHPELVKALSWWKEARPCKVDNVFMQTQCASAMGEPYRQRLHFMDTLCERAGVKPFGFHAMRHKSAAITFVSGGLNAAQVLMGHYRATTTDTYVRSAGLYTDHTAILDALGNSEIGQAVGGLLEKEMPQEAESRGASCNQNHVTNVILRRKSI